MGAFDQLFDVGTVPILAGPLQDGWDKMMAMVTPSPEVIQQTMQQAAPVTAPAVQELAKQADPQIQESAKKGVLEGLRDLPLPVIGLGVAVLGLGFSFLVRR